MTLEQIIELAIPITAKDCNLTRQRKEWQREQTKQRIQQWHEQRVNAIPHITQEDGQQIRQTSTTSY